jgi:hypothetical protein
VWAAPTCSSFLKVEVSSFTFKKNKDFLVAYDGDLRIGFIQYGYIPEIKTLKIEDMEVKSKYRGLKLSRIFLQKALLEFPEADLIDSLLVGTNQEAYFKAKESSVTSKDVFSIVKQTPAYKIRAALGFSRIVEYEQAQNHIVLVVERDNIEN